MVLKRVGTLATTTGAGGNVVSSWGGAKITAVNFVPTAGTSGTLGLYDATAVAGSSAAALVFETGAAVQFETTSAVATGIWLDLTDAPLVFNTGIVAVGVNLTSAGVFTCAETP